MGKFLNPIEGGSSQQFSLPKIHIPWDVFFKLFMGALVCVFFFYAALKLFDLLANTMVSQVAEQAPVIFIIIATFAVVGKGNRLFRGVLG